MTKKPAGTRITMHETIHDRAMVEVGDVLETSTGRRYGVIGVAGRKIECIVMRIGATVADDARIVRWQWNPRHKKEALRFRFGSAKR